MSQPWIGPVPVDLFLNEFMDSGASLTLPQSALEVKFPSQGGSESALYESFSEFVQKAEICPGVHFHTTAHTGPTDRDDQEHRDENSLGEHDGEVIPQKQPFDWQYDGLIVEFKSTEAEDPFCSLEDAKECDSFQKTDRRSRRTLCKLANYTWDSFSYQHRVHLFMLFIAGNVARFIRWDRAGAIVSASFDYVEDSKPLMRFLGSFAKLDDAQRGWNTTVSRPLPNEVEEFRAAINSWIERHGGVEVVRRRFPGAESTLDEEYSTYKITVKPEIGKSQTLIVRRPFSQSGNLVGRATRTYFAYSTTPRIVVFYKEGWRVEADVDHSETTAYRKLKEGNVQHIPTILCAGDVIVDESPLRTLSDIWARETDEECYVPCPAPPGLVLQRIVQSVVYPVQWLLSSLQFVTVLCDCTIAVDQAEKIGLLHRDISIGNVMAKFDDDGQTFVGGILIDWDNFGYTDSDHEGQTTRRHGTWQFMSIEILKNPTIQHSIVHDMESIYWVLRYGSYRFFENSGGMQWEIFSEKDWNEYSGSYVGGKGKNVSLLDDDNGEGITTPALRTIIDRFGFEWCQYYHDPIVIYLKSHHPSTRPVLPKELDELRLPELLAPEDTISYIMTRLEPIRMERSKPQFWIDLFKQFIALNDKSVDFWPPDAVDDKYPQHTENAARIKRREEVISSTTNKSDGCLYGYYIRMPAMTTTTIQTSDNTVPSSTKKRAHDDRDEPHDTSSSSKKPRRCGGDEGDAGQ
ncbi:hypothetical protein BDY19DRAFT_664127 [Irpex rosettiformis]|uniref:Uncharacterized protein n=1 Tax=Irpex rosettiformis TaxID=378272 RepID=A0ACB8U9Y8_9APHY|nr:hypothetical protein BDY19DRAFT_664127 [Irpex rosettiformis]